MSMELDSGSITLEQITHQMLVHQNELRQLREEKAAMQQHLESLMSAPTPASAPLPPARKALPFKHIFDGDKTMFKSWQTAITSKLRSDAAFIGNHEQQWFFINEMLSMKVQPRGTIVVLRRHSPPDRHGQHFVDEKPLLFVVANEGSVRPPSR
ncbi:hypothetical protein E4U58_001687 [Claviceps cyperi]|nr:hypothetical protein E4U58_001687 [Claviceps cyperi]